MQTVTLYNGVKMPILGFGVFRIPTRKSANAACRTRSGGLPAHRHGCVVGQPQHPFSCFSNPHRSAGKRFISSSMKTQKGDHTSTNTSQTSAGVTHGTPEQPTLEVKRLGDMWIVENGVGECVADASDCAGVVRQACELAKAQGGSGISVLGDDGSVHSVTN